MNRFMKILYPFLPIELIDMIHNFYTMDIFIHKYKKVVNEIKSIDKIVKSKCFDDLTMQMFSGETTEIPWNYILYKEDFMYYFNSKLPEEYRTYFNNSYFSRQEQSRKNHYIKFHKRKWIDL